MIASSIPLGSFGKSSATRAFGVFWLQEPASFSVAQAEMAMLRGINPGKSRIHKEIGGVRKASLTVLKGGIFFSSQIQRTFAFYRLS